MSERYVVSFLLMKYSLYFYINTWACSTCSVLFLLFLFSMKVCKWNMASGHKAISWLKSICSPRHSQEYLKNTGFVWLNIVTLWYFVVFKSAIPIGTIKNMKPFNIQEVFNDKWCRTFDKICLTKANKTLKERYFSNANCLINLLSLCSHGNSAHG